ncbi:MAG: type II secretion system protein [Candidatus Aminicenantes bacterium]|nr:type II secretion system protein [Candidatus Aminicenantes bacterium]
MKQEEKGFTMIEMLISTTMLLLIMYSVFMMIEFQMEFSKTQQARTRLVQESRYLLSTFSSDLKNAGAVLTLAHTGGFLTKPPYFNGVFPINGVDTGTADTYPDGIIIASADPDAVTTLSQALTPVAGGDIPVNETLVISPALPWAQGDKGIIMGIDGYYIFSVGSVGASGNTLTMEGGAIYYSGMLNSPAAPTGTSTGYVDTPPAEGTGDGIEYPLNAPVMRLTNFGIYLVNERYDKKLEKNVREFIKVTDANGDTSGDFLSSGSSCIKGVIAENIWDFQISYFCYPNYPDHTMKDEYFAPGSTGTNEELLKGIRDRILKEILVSVVALSPKHAGKGKFTNQVPGIGDCSGYTLPLGKYNYQLFNLNIDPRNFNISI